MAGTGKTLSIVICSLLISACNSGPSEPAQAVLRVESDDPAIETVRTINVIDTNVCQLSVQKGRDDPEIYSPKTCTITRKDGFAVDITVGFDAPCRQYQFKNLIGDKYFLDEKSIGTRVAACAIDTFNTSYAWRLDDSAR